MLHMPEKLWTGFTISPEQKIVAIAPREFGTRVLYQPGTTWFGWVTITCEFNQSWWWISSDSNHTNGGGGWAYDMNGNAELMLDNRVAWHEFCWSPVDKQKVDKARQWQKKPVLSLASSSPVDPALGWAQPQASSLSTESGEICFLRQQDPAEKFTKASALALDAGVRSCAHTIGGKTC